MTTADERYNQTASQQPHSGLRMRARELTERVLELRTPKEEGAKAPSMREIAEELGVSVSTVHAALWRGIEAANERIADKAEDLRDVELEYLDQLIQALWPDLDHKSPEVREKVIKRLQALGESRRRLLGIDKPAKVEVTQRESATVTLYLPDNGR